MSSCSSHSRRSTTSYALARAGGRKPSTIARCGRASSPSPTALPAHAQMVADIVMPTSASRGRSDVACRPGHVARAAPRLADVAFTVVDLETTGATPGFRQDHRDWRGEARGRTRDRYVPSLVNPGIPIPEMITGITGIDDRDGLPMRPRSSGDAALRRLRPRVPMLVATTRRFDLSFLDYELGPVCSAARSRARRWDTAPRLARKLCRSSAVASCALSYR